MKETPKVANPKRYTKKQLMEMTKKEIVKLSLSALNVKNDGRVRKEELIEEFMLDQRNYFKNKNHYQKIIQNLIIFFWK